MLNFLHDSQDSQEMIVNNEKESQKLAQQLANSIKRQDIITFTGDLGSGKTFFCREIIKSLCGNATNVISPTFNLLQTYEYKNCLIYHFDLYRLNYSNEIYELGIEEAFLDHICLIEWPLLIEGILPKNSKNIRIEIIDEFKRKVIF